jgi:hypothetical protein
MVDLSAPAPWRSKVQDPAMLPLDFRTALSLAGFAASLVFVFAVTLM